MMRRRRFLGMSLAVALMIWRDSNIQQPWRLGIVGRSELGINTWLGRGRRRRYNLFLPILSEKHIGGKT